MILVVSSKILERRGEKLKWNYLGTFYGVVEAIHCTKSRLQQMGFFPEN